MKIVKVEKKSIAYDLGIKRGDVLISINGKLPEDNLEYNYFNNLKRLVVIVRNHTDSKEYSYKIKKEETESLGLELEGLEQIETTTLQGNCMFCLPEQFPDDMSNTLYFKNDDWRLSFAAKRYLPLANITQTQIKRIIAQKASPLFVAVHATNEKVRKKLLGVSSSMPVLKLIKKLTRNKIIVNCQIVLCPGINDGAVLHRTIKDLLKCGKNLKSIAVVPVSITKHRSGLSQLKPVNKEDAKKALTLVHRMSDKYFLRRGEHSVFASDELYLQAKEMLPSYSFYGDFSQLDNNVGVLSKFEKEFLDAMAEVRVAPKNTSYTIVSGVASFDFMTQLTQKFSEAFPSVSVNVVKIINNFLGESIASSAMLSGADILGQISSFLCNKSIVLPRCMIHNDGKFIDGMTLEDFKSALNKKVFIAGDAGSSLIDVLVGKGGENA